MSNSKEQPFNHFQTANIDQHTNFNLNANLKCPVLIPVQSYSTSYNDKNCNSVVFDIHKEKIKSDLYLNSLNDEKRPHISYISAVALDDGSNGTKFNANTKQYFNAASIFIIRNPFEFPRQQNDKINDPEVSRFKSSQHLINQNANPGSSIVTTHADTTPIYFVVLKDLEDLSALQERQLNEAHELLKSHAAVAATSKENALKFPVGGICYVIPYFEGDLYQHLVQRNASIYGPLAIIQCLTKTGVIPLSPKPLFAFYCSNFNVTGTGLNDGERTNIGEKIVQLGGLYSGTMTSKTTHLFAHMCDPKSEKYQRAVKDKILIVSPAWVDFAYEAARHEELVDSIPLGNFKIQIFTGCVMSSSGFISDQQQNFLDFIDRVLNNLKVAEMKIFVRNSNSIFFVIFFAFFYCFCVFK